MTLTEVISVPRPLLKELYEHFDKIEEILATLEELSDKKGLKRIEKSLEEYEKKDYVTVANPKKIREVLMKDWALPYKSVFTRGFTKEFNKLPKSTKEQILKALEKTVANPYAGTKLRGKLEGLWRCRAGKYRAIYTIDEEEKTIVFLDVGLRKSIYDWHDKTKNLNAVVNLSRPTKAYFA